MGIIDRSECNTAVFRDVRNGTDARYWNREIVENCIHGSEFTCLRDMEAGDDYLSVHSLVRQKNGVC